MNLIKTDSLPERLQGNKILSYLLNPTIRDLVKDRNGEATVLAAIGKAFIDQHKYNGAMTADRYSDEDVAGVQRSVFELIVTDYKNLTLHEIIHSFKRGMCGKYGDPHYFSAFAVNHWLKSYSDIERKPVVRDYHKAITDQANQISTEPNESERLQIRKEIFEGFADWIDKERSLCAEAMELGTFKAESINMPLNSSFWYEKLIHIELIKEPSTEEKIKWYDKALKTIRPSKDQADLAKIKAKQFIIRDNIYQWIINDKPYRQTLLTSIDKF